jgi:hypothetical protein
LSDIVKSHNATTKSEIGLVKRSEVRSSRGELVIEDALSRFSKRRVRRGTKEVSAKRSFYLKRAKEVTATLIRLLAL